VTHAVLNAFILDINTRTLPKHVPKGLILGTHIPYYLYVITDSVWLHQNVCVAHIARDILYCTFFN
jgi:hypothetical protein